MKINSTIAPKDLTDAADRVFALAAKKARAIDRSWNRDKGTPVFTVKGRYTTQGWTEWTQGFQYGCMILAGDGLDDRKLIDLGRRRTNEFMLPHVTHIGVHDHGFNNLSTYGNLLRLLDEKRLPENEWEAINYRNVIAASGAVQAARWSGISVPEPSKHAANSKQLGYIYSFNGPQSLFIDTMRTIRILDVGWQLGHVLMHEHDRRADLLKRSVLHALASSQYIVFHGDSGHTYDIRGRTAHEGIFNRNDGRFRARATQQGYSPFSTWTRGLSWAVLGFAEQLEFLKTVDAAKFKASTGLSKRDVVRVYERNAKETCEHYIEDVSTTDGITYWDDGAPGLAQMSDWRDRPAQPDNAHEPVDATASAITAQGLIRLGNYLGTGPNGKGRRYYNAGLTIARTLFDEPYLSTKANHQGLLLHSIYHRPNGWDYIPPGKNVPQGESSMWGDYHLLELALLIHRMANKQPYLKFFL